MSASIKAAFAHFVNRCPSLGQHTLFHFFSCDPRGYCECYETHFKACERQEQDLQGQEEKIPGIG